jgi:hypothetical protein
LQDEEFARAYGAEARPRLELFQQKKPLRAKGREGIWPDRA